MNKIKMVSGIGQFHTNEPDKDKRTPYLAIGVSDIVALVDKPQQVDKSQAQWLIPSSYPSRNFKEQEQHGRYFCLWADLDQRPFTLSKLETILKDIIPSDYEIYNTSSATVDNQKARILIPLTEPLNFADWSMAQQVLNNELERLKVIPDRANERAAQLCYLPNRGKFYGSRSQRDGVFFNPLHTWSNEITVKRDEMATQQAEISKAKQLATEKRATLKLSDAPNLIAAFNLAYTPDEFLLNAGYAQKGNSFRHPNSETGNYSASLLNGRVNSLSSGDPLYSGGQGAHDAFSCFTALVHEGNKDAALRDAGDNLLTIGVLSFNKALQREHMQKKSAQQKQAPIPSQAQAAFIDDVDYSTMPDYGQLPDNTGQNENVPLVVPLKKDVPLFKFADASELMNRAYAPDFLIKTLFESNALGQVFGATGSGKSFVVLDMAYCIATGLDYHGLTTKQGNVAYICGEGFRAIGRRVKALQNKYDATIAGKLFISEQPGAFIDIGVTSSVADAIKSIGNVSLVIIDTYHRNMGGGNENSADDFGVILRNIDTFLKPLNVAVLIVHHSGHMETDRSRGSSAIRAAMDFEYQVSKSGDTVSLKATKIKDGTTPHPMYFSLVDSEIGLDHEGNPITSAYLDGKEGGAVQSGTKSRLNTRDDAILTSLNDAITAHGIEPSADIKAKFGGFDSMVGKLQKIVHIDHWRDMAYKVITIDDDGKDPAQALRRSFIRTRKKLQDADYIVVTGNYAWRFFDDSKG